MEQYSAPALDKGLDILELLSDEAGGLSQSEIAEATGRSVGQIFRVLATLERRGYVTRDAQSGLYAFSMRIFDLAHRHPPLRGLISIATPAMRDLAERVRQSCNPVSYTHLRAHETPEHLVCRLLLEKKKIINDKKVIHCELKRAKHLTTQRDYPSTTYNDDT